MKKFATLKRSQFILGQYRALRGLTMDVRVLLWLATRKVKIAGYLRAHQVKKLQIGTSNNILDGWLNTDSVLNDPSVVYLNATAKFPFDTNTFDYVMAEHMIEHIEYHEGQTMLQECYRVLKPGGRARFSTPDMGVLLALHSKDKTEIQIHYINWIATNLMPEVRECKDVFVINNAFRFWGHLFLYDQGTLDLALRSAGFREIRFYKAGDSEDPNLQKLESHGREIQAEDINQFETIVVEGCKPR
jgi:predicted SAM-dependent methyltransferase